MLWPAVGLAVSGSVVHEMTWTVAGYPGNWYWYWKSIKFNRTNTGYKYGTVVVPTTADKAGYHNG